MSPTKKRQSKPKHKSLLLSRTRPAVAVLPANIVASSGITKPVRNSTITSITSKASRTLIRSLHTLQKRRAQAEKKGDTKAIAEIDAEIAKQGGLEKYQLASLNGQSSSRGGDSSGVLMEWLGASVKGSGKKFRVLEVGALSVDNVISKNKRMDVTRIDLNSVHPAIETQDFMERPLPKNDSERFHIISLSLVLNFVPSIEGRGAMLERLSSFLLPPTPIPTSEEQTTEDELSLGNGVFLVLPAPCVENSRYMDKERMQSIMEDLGYKLEKEKTSNKLVYYYWRWIGTEHFKGRPRRTWKKEEIRSGAKRNNFAVVLA
ncbi:hypothetical protein BJ508DRAFT_369793 [Ascobolus immersus RN42]|uniref:25S rRNA adenine-N(1) methyltransferase n=1 Tax=Ascobolus immersus RN42 TaxID=1160509 RepID=A0A3N4IBD7_ASCIM|nr:hypothetical protein BJ508DRAFT_369793 [Ascobolus immersus RN42]